MSLTWYDSVGIIGVLFVLGAYLALQLKKVEATAPAYSAFNALGAGLILISLYYDFNLSAFLIESAWLLISLFGLCQAYRAHK